LLGGGTRFLTESGHPLDRFSRMPIDKRLLQILSCPVSQQPLATLDREALDRLNREISEGTVRGADGTRVEGPIDDALVTADGRLAYPVVDGIPVLLPEGGILLAATDRSGT